MNRLEYAMGFLYADGCLTYQRGRRPRLCFAQKDYETVERVVDVLRPYFSNRGGISQFPDGTWQFRVYLKPNEVDLFTKYGIIPRKSYEVSYPKQWTLDFLRGMIEGDGSWIIVRPSSPLFHLQITNAHPPVLHSLHDWLKGQGLVGGGVYRRSTAFDLRFSTHDAIRLSYALYHNLTEADALSSRKYRQAQKWKELWEFDPSTGVIKPKSQNPVFSTDEDGNFKEKAVVIGSRD